MFGALRREENANTEDRSKRRCARACHGDGAAVVGGGFRAHCQLCDSLAGHARTRKSRSKKKRKKKEGTALYKRINLSACVDHQSGETHNLQNPRHRGPSDWVLGGGTILFVDVHKKADEVSTSSQTDLCALARTCERRAGVYTHRSITTRIHRTLTRSPCSAWEMDTRTFPRLLR